MISSLESCTIGGFYTPQPEQQKFHESKVNHSRGCTVCEQGTGRTMTHGVEAAALNPQLLKQRMQLLRP